MGTEQANAHGRVCCRGSLVAVRRLDGAWVEYDLVEGTSVETAQPPYSEEEGGDREIVPVYCHTCYPGIIYPSAAQLLSSAPFEYAGLLVGTSCVFSPDAPAFKPTGIDGDLTGEFFERYTPPYETFYSTVHPSPGDFYHAHKQRVGTVLAYWHVHKAKSVFLNTLCALEAGPLGTALMTTYANVKPGLSLGTYDWGLNEVIRECSITIVPARGGCFGVLIEADSSKLASALDTYCYGSAICPLRLASFPGKDEEKDTPVVTFLEEFAGLQKDYINVLRLCYQHKGTATIEEYLKHGDNVHRALTREESSAEEKYPTLLEGRMQQPQPQQHQVPQQVAQGQAVAQYQQPGPSQAPPMPYGMWGAPSYQQQHLVGPDMGQQLLEQLGLVKKDTARDVLTAHLEAIVDSRFRARETAQAPPPPPPTTSPDYLALKDLLTTFLASPRSASGPPPPEEPVRKRARVEPEVVSAVEVPPSPTPDMSQLRSTMSGMEKSLLELHETIRGLATRIPTIPSTPDVVTPVPTPVAAPEASPQVEVPVKDAALPKKIPSAESDNVSAFLKALKTK